MTANGSSITEDITTSALLLVHLYRKLVCQKKGSCYCLSKKGRCYNVCDITTKICLAEKMEVLLSVISHQVIRSENKGGVCDITCPHKHVCQEKGRCYCFLYHHISSSFRKREVLLFLISPHQLVCQKRGGVIVRDITLLACCRKGEVILFFILPHYLL